MIYHYDEAMATDVVGRSVRTPMYRYTEWGNSRQDRELYLSDRAPYEYINQIDDAAVKTRRTEGEHWLQELKMPKPGPVTRGRGQGKPLQKERKES